jgi:hypothetical protein
MYIKNATRKNEVAKRKAAMVQINQSDTTAGSPSSLSTS